MRSPAAERRRPTPWDALVAVAVAAAAVLLLLGLRPADGDTLTARITVDGALAAEYNLTVLSGPAALPMDELPYSLTVELEPGRIRVAESACPGKDCVHTGWVDRAGGQIICLPNRLVISVTGAEAPSFDAVTG